MSRVLGNNVEIEYECIGSSADPPLVFISGLGGQMTFWDKELCQGLAEQGLWVIRFDQRDSGLSTRFEQAHTPPVLQMLLAALQGEPVDAPYTLNDMANDAIGLLDALGVQAAHVVGLSLGGMIAQVVTLCHPSRVLTLTSIMSGAGDLHAMMGDPAALSAVFQPAASADREANIERSVAMCRTFNHPSFPFEEERLRRWAAQAYDRSFYPEGTTRQILAIVASGSHQEQLQAIQQPVLVIHGSRDPLIPLAAGQSIARAVPAAELLVIEGLGHELPLAVWPQVLGAIGRHTRKVQPAGWLAGRRTR